MYASDMFFALMDTLCYSAMLVNLVLELIYRNFLSGKLLKTTLISPRGYIENLMLKKNDLVFKSMRYDDDEPGIIMPNA